MRMKDFCKRHGLYLNMEQLKQGADDFVAEIDRGLAGSGSLETLPSYIDPSVVPDLSQKVIVIDAGGTNLRVALVSLANLADPVIEYFENYPMPGTRETLTGEEFFSRLADKIIPVADKANKIGFCFSFPAQILPNRDARIMRFSKELKISGADGRLLGEGLLGALKSKGAPHEMSIAVINDTVAALLGGMAGTGGRVFDNYAGLILGTGTNTCYVEDNAKVKKDPELASKPGKTLINLESGGYGLAPRGDLDVKYDSTTVLPGDHKFEKMISGLYQGGLFLVYLKAAAEEGCFSAEAAERIAALDSVAAKDIDDFCDFPYGSGLLASLAGANEDDRAALYTLADAIFDRIAILMTMNVAALLRRMDSGKSPWKPVCISAEGTTFYKSRLFRPKLDYYVESYIRQELGLYCEFVKVENNTILGTAVAGLLSPARH